MESADPEKVYVAIGTDCYDGFSTLQWALRKWSDDGVRIVILHIANTVCKDYVYTPIGKLPTSSVNEEKLRVLEKSEEANRNKILSQYITFCGKVETEVIEIGNNEQQPLREQIIDIISAFGITKLVMSLGFMKYSSVKSRTSINESFYIVRHKPDFCEVYVICGGRLVFLRGESDEEGFIEDDKGLMLAKLKEKNSSIRSWLGRMFPENVGNISNNTAPDSSSSSSSSFRSNDSAPSSRSSDSHHQWKKCNQEIENYVSWLLSAKGGEIDGASAVSMGESTELFVSEISDASERIQALKSKIRNCQEAIHWNRKQSNAAKERCEKAEWAVSICNIRAEELEDGQNKEIVKTIDLNKELESRREEIDELQSEVDQKRSKLSSILEIQKELTSKLHTSSSAKACAEVHLEKTVQNRSKLVQEIEELRKQRDILHRRIEFCKEKDAIGKVSKSNSLGFDFREFSADEILVATEDISDHLRLKSEGRLTDVYRGRVNHITVAIKMYISGYAESKEDFTTKVNLLSQIRHPNILAMIGFCPDLNCIVYEFMHNGSLSDSLFPTTQIHSLSWHARIRITAEICSALAFLHKSKPKPVIQGNLKPSKVLLDQNNVARIVLDFNDPQPQNQETNMIKLDVQAFGNLVLQLLTGKDSIDLAENESLDHSAGQWPVDLAMELCAIATKCLSEDEMGKMPVREINDLRKRADVLVVDSELSLALVEEGTDVSVTDLSNLPNAFLCPIYQDVMKNPYLVADGFSYELEAIEEWLRTGHDTSPMTNLRLTHKLLTPNHTLRSLIQDWLNKGSRGT